MKMKAIVKTAYGGPEVLRLEEIEKPVPKDGQVLVKIHAASANPADYHAMRGGMARVLAPLIMRENIGMRKPKDPSFGSDIAGTVEAVGPNVTKFKVGDEVFGTCTKGSGGFAEYACARETRLGPKPENITFEEAAGIPIAALTALQGLRDRGKSRQGQGRAWTESPRERRVRRSRHLRGANRQVIWSRSHRRLQQPQSGPDS